MVMQKAAWAPYVEPAVHDFFSTRHRHELLHEPRPVPVRLRDGSARSSRGTDSDVTVEGAWTGALRHSSRGGAMAQARAETRVHARHRGASSPREEHERPIAGRSPWYLAWRRLRRNYVALRLALRSSSSIVVACALAPVYAHHVAHTGPERQPRRSTRSSVEREDRCRVDLAGGVRPKTGKHRRRDDPIGPTVVARRRQVRARRRRDRPRRRRAPALRRPQLAAGRHRLVADLRRSSPSCSRCSPATSAAGSTS